ncbi:MAG: hypothetical protein AAFX41_05595 [Bacteroidota bacterium]
MSSYQGRRRLFVFVVASLAFSSCQPTSEYWTNFSFETDEKGQIIPLGESAVLPPPEGYEAVIRVDSTYYYLRNRGNLRMDLYLPESGERGIGIGHFVHNEDSYFTYRHNYSNQEGRWQIAVAKLGGGSQVLGDCIGYDSEHVLIVQEGRRKMYNYRLKPARKTSTIECEIFPPDPPVVRESALTEN